LAINQELRWTVWDLVSELDRFHVEFDHGEDPTPEAPGIVDVLAPHLKTATFNCTMSPCWENPRRLEFVRNKYGTAVAGALFTEVNELLDGSKARGVSVLLPQVGTSANA
jgi:hypothetical protein